MIRSQDHFRLSWWGGLSGIVKEARLAMRGLKLFRTFLVEFIVVCQCWYVWTLKSWCRDLLLLYQGELIKFWSKFKRVNLRICSVYSAFLEYLIHISISILFVILTSNYMYKYFLLYNYLNVPLYCYTSIIMMYLSYFRLYLR